MNADALTARVADLQTQLEALETQTAQMGEQLRAYAHQHRQARVAATKALEKVKPEISSKPLRARLSDDVVLVRVAAAEALARRKDQKALPALASLAQNTTRPSVRAAAAYAYGLIGGVPL